MDAIEVTADFDAAGRATPLRFSWKGRSYRVMSTGRRWQDEQGQHTLVMVAGEKVYDLVFAACEGRWYLRQIGPESAFA